MQNLLPTYPIALLLLVAITAGSLYLTTPAHATLMLGSFELDIESIDVRKYGLPGPFAYHHDLFGSSVVSLGDLNGDGIQDLAVGAHNSDRGGYDIGTVHILFMNRDGSVQSSTEINGDTPNGPVLTSRSTFGKSITTIGDLNGDNVTDIVVGASQRHDSAHVSGVLYLIFMNPDGSVQDTTKIDGTTPNGPVLAQKNNFGHSVTTADINLDGVLDIVTSSTMPTGAIHILFMNPNGSVQHTIEINNATPNIPALEPSFVFGRSVANIGDLNQDNIPDLAVSISQHTNDDIDQGAVYILFMNTNGSVQNSTIINRHTPNGPTIVNTSEFGISITAVGDLNGDGIDDLAVGARADNLGDTSNGVLHLLHMNRDGTVQSTITFNRNTPNMPALDINANFGYSVADIGDLDGDGIRDLAVGAPALTQSTSQTGDLYILFMNRDGSIRNTVHIDNDASNGLVLRADDRFGWAVTEIGDLNQDGTQDLAVGMPGKRSYSGAYQVLFMNPNGSVQSSFELALPRLIHEVGAGDLFGSAITNIDDLGGDDIQDLAVGASGDDMVYILFMDRPGNTQIYGRIQASTPNGPVIAAGDQFGFSITDIGDLNGDRVRDLAIGAPRADRGGEDTGAVHIVFMHRHTTIVDTAEITEGTLNVPALSHHDYFGSSVANLGDLDGDGIQDIAVGASGDNTVHIIFLNRDGTVKRSTQINGASPNHPIINSADNFGTSVIAVGDLDGNNITDIAVGAVNNNHGAPHKGTIHLISLNRDGTVRASVPITSTTPGAPAPLAHEYLGNSFAILSDSDKPKALVVGSPHNDYGEADSGTLNIIFLNSLQLRDATYTANMIEDTSITLSLTDALHRDDADTLQIQSITTPNNGTAQISDNTVTYTPDTNYYGVDTFKYTIIKSGTHLTNTGTATINIAPVFDHPTLIAIPDHEVYVNEVLTFTVAATDVDSTMLTFSLSERAPTGATINSTTGVFTWRPTPAQDGVHAFNVSVSDETALADTQQIIVTVNPTIPVITLLGDNPQIIEVGHAYTELNARAMDSIDGDITSRIMINTDNVNTDAIGTYTVVYTVENSLGHSAVPVHRHVHVVLPIDIPSPNSILLDDPLDGSLDGWEFYNHTELGVLPNDPSVFTNYVVTFVDRDDVPSLVDDFTTSQAALITGDAAHQFVGIIKYIDVSVIDRMVPLYLTFEWRAQSDSLAPYITNALWGLTTTNGIRYFDSHLVNGGTADSGWNTFQRDISGIIGDHDMVGIRLYLHDSSIENHNQKLWLDNIRVTVGDTSGSGFPG